MLRLALDAMGGDLGPRSVVEGACLFLKEDSSVCFNIFGDQAQIKPLIPANFSNKLVDVMSPNLDLEVAINKFTKLYLEKVIASLGQSASRVGLARTLGVSRNTIRRYLKDFSIELPGG